MSLYPTLEDLKVDQMMKAQLAHEAPAKAPHSAPPAAYSAPPAAYSAPPAAYSAQPAAPPYPLTPSSAPVPAERYSSLYPQLDDYMGLQLQEINVPGHAVMAMPPQHVISVPAAPSAQMVAPVTGQSLGLARAQVSHGIRELVLCKDKNGKVGFRVQAINKGVFIILVQKNTPAAMAGLRFGDQILMLNDVVVAGFSVDKVHDMVKKSNPNRITMVVRDRPFERVVTVHKDSVGHVGFGFKNGKVVNIVKDSSAARNGLLIDHNMLEVNGQNVVSLKDKEVTEIIKHGGQVITLTIMPSFVFEHLVKNTASSFLKKTMDHSIPDI